MKLRVFAKSLFTMVLFSLSDVHADDVSKGRDLFIHNCIAYHAFTCNLDGHEAYSPKLGGLFGRKAGGVEDFDGYSEGLRTVVGINYKLHIGNSVLWR